MASLSRKYLSVALAVAAGAILLCSCREESPEVDPAADEALMTEYSENLTIIESKNGQRSYRFSTPLVEGYSQAREPYREFRKGIRMVTYQDDSLASVDVVLTANYAIYYENRKLWEAKGNVVVEKYDGKKLYTQQLFWNATTKKVYSNVDTRVVQEGHSDIIGAGFESDEEFKDWRFRYMKGKTEVDVAPREQADSVQRDSTAQQPSVRAERPSLPAQPVRPERPTPPVQREQPARSETPAQRESSNHDRSAEREQRTLPQRRETGGGRAEAERSGRNSQATRLEQLEQPSRRNSAHTNAENQ